MARLTLPPRLVVALLFPALAACAADAGGERFDYDASSADPAAYYEGRFGSGAATGPAASPAAPGGPSAAAIRAGSASGTPLDPGGYRARLAAPGDDGISRTDPAGAGAEGVRERLSEAAAQDRRERALDAQRERERLQLASPRPGLDAEELRRARRGAARGEVSQDLANSVEAARDGAGRAAARGAASASPGASALEASDEMSRRARSRFERSATVPRPRRQGGVPMVDPAPWP